MMLRRAAAAMPAIAALALAACAAEPPPEAPPQPQASAAPMSPIMLEPKGSSPADQEMLALARAEDEIDKLFPGKNKESAKKGDGKPADAPAKDEAQTLSGGAVDACAVACRALASMANSAEHLCKLSGEGDGRCEDARGRVRGATARVHQACPACSAGPR